MPTITLSVPAELKGEMDKVREINWSEVAREAIREKLAQLRMLSSILSRSKLTKRDALELGETINKSLHARYKQAHPDAY